MEAATVPMKAFLPIVDADADADAGLLAFDIDMEKPLMDGIDDDAIIATAAQMMLLMLFMIC